MLLGSSSAWAQANAEFLIWGIADPVDEAQYFPLLPDERVQGSVSVGDVSEGFLARATRVNLPQPHTAFLPVQFKRNLAYTTDEMAALVQTASEVTARKHPAAVVFLGNFSARHGGHIPYSVSHNSGRDCDLAFFMRDAQGHDFVPPDLVELDENGVWTREDGQQFFFDTPRNWTLIEALLAHDGGALQYIFLSNGLKRLLLEHARASGAPAAVIQAADEVIAQPGGALPHNDHFHLRAYCSDDDVWGGCVDQGRITSRRQHPKVTRQAAVEWVGTYLDHPHAPVRKAAIVRLGWLDARSAARQIESLLRDESPVVRAAAARVLGRLKVAGASMAERLHQEEHPIVRIELITALSEVGGKDTVDGLAQILASPRKHSVADVRLDERTLAADGLARLEDSRGVKALIDALGTNEEPVRERILHSLRRLTNQGLGESQDAWLDWYKREGKKKRQAWLIAGFKAEGFKVEKLGPRDVWELCRAIHGRDFLSYNAQRTLMKIADREAPSLEWSMDDASFYWRRWFERRASRYGVPPIPPELSTLKPGGTVSKP